MRVVITGGGGFLGQRLARDILRRGSLTNAQGQTQPVRELVLLDQVAPNNLGDARVTCLQGDITERATLATALSDNTDSVFHLAAVVSGQAEAEFDVGMAINLDASRTLLELCRTLPRPPKIVFTSSLAVFGGELPSPVPDSQAITPQGSYGAQKAMVELLVSDMSRKGMIDGRSVRLPTVTIRPGKANKAASSFASGILREPLNGVEAICPVSDQTVMYCLSPRKVIDSLILAHEVEAGRFPAASRSVTVPGRPFSVRDMLDALRRVAGDAVAARVKFIPDPAVQRLVETWPPNFEARLGTSLGMRVDESFDDIIRAYIEDENISL